MKVPNVLKSIWDESKHILIPLLVLFVLYKWEGYTADKHYDEGYDSGYDSGYSEGCKALDTDGYYTGYNLGYIDGYDFGYSEGHESYKSKELRQNAYISGFINGYTKCKEGVFDDEVEVLLEYASEELIGQQEYCVMDVMQVDEDGLWPLIYYPYYE